MTADETTTPERIRSAVTDRYSRIGVSPAEETAIPTGRAWALRLGYPAALLDALPEDAIESFTGIGTPVLDADLIGGESVLDLGCGAGMDVLLAAQQVGPSGKVYGVDRAPGMALRARRVVNAAGRGNVVILESGAEQVPLPNGAVDVALCNGLFNLVPDKTAIAEELVRVLRPGGRIVGAEIVLTDGRPPGELDEEAWFR